jgi:bifunctional UDP-N-acetylglucosamine pyrophosphorylase/glucosamine-1-phosphate N-acetyltransferase
VGEDTYLGAGTRLYGETSIGANVVVEGDSLIENSVIGDGVHLKLGCYIESSQIGPRCEVGPFAHLRPGTTLGAQVKIGNFVETKKSIIADGAKANHLSYIGDAEVGAGANIGAGTITCNYDGYQKFKTVIGEGAFIGSNTSLIAPVTVGARAVVGAGSAISKDVPAEALGLERSQIKIIEKWSERRNRDRS